MKNKKLLIVSCLLLALMLALFLASCNMEQPGGDSSSDSDYSQTGGTLTQELTVDEGDIVKSFGNLAYKLQSDGIVVYRLIGGQIEQKAYYKFSSARKIPLELYVSDESIMVVYGKTSYVEDDSYSVINYGKNESYSKLYIEIFSNPVPTYDGDDVLDLTTYQKYSFNISAKLLVSRMYVSSKYAYFAFRYNEEYVYGDYDVNSSKSDSEETVPTTVSYVENGNYKTFDGTSKVPAIDSVTNTNRIVFVSIDVDDPDACAINAVYGAALKDIYISETSIIPIFTETVRNYPQSGCSYYFSDYTTKRNVHLFKLSPTTLKIVDSVSLQDYTIYDRRAVKDYGDTIYVTATKTDGSGTTVIALDGERFSLLNKLEKIAPDENVKSVTYDEEDGKRYCYITTYLQVDPLFKIDITDPYKMVTLGYMKVPGYSTFMLNVGDYLITIGYASNGRQGTQSSVKVSLYSAAGDDLSLIDDRIIQNVVYAEAISDPTAIALSNTSFAFSATVQTDSSYITQALYVFDVQCDELALLGKISNFSSGDDYGDNSITYANDDGEVKKTTSFGKYALSIQRARFIGDYLYTFSDGVIASYKVDTDEGGVKQLATAYTDKVFTHFKQYDLYSE